MGKYRTWFTDPYDGNKRLKQITFNANGYDEAVGKALALQKEYEDENDTVTEMNMIYVRERAKQ